MTNPWNFTLVQEKHKICPKQLWKTFVISSEHFYFLHEFEIYIYVSNCLRRQILILLNDGIL